MSYRIEYDGREGKYEIRKKRTGLLIPVTLVVLLGVFSLPAETMSALSDWLIPGTDAVTVQAFQSMTDDLRSGADLSEALEGFCRFVIHGQ